MTTSSTGFTDADKEDRRVVIKIAHGDITTHKLVMRDKNGNLADSVLAWSHQIIKWKIADTANVKSIEKIFRKGDKEVFAKKPHKKSPKKWKGKLKDVQDKEEEEYYINWKDDTGSPHKFDPYIQVRPRNN